MESIVDISTHLVLPTAQLIHKEAVIQNRPVGSISITTDFVRSRVIQEALVGHFDATVIARVVLKKLWLEFFG